MAIRYIDTGFFKSPFVRSLKAPLKTLYCFIICDCDGAGIWTADFEIASVYIGFKIDQNEFEKSFAQKFVDLKNGKYFFPDFIEHQYPKGLQSSNPAHKNFIEELQKYKLLDGALKPLARPFEGSICNSNSNSNGISNSNSNTEPKRKFEKPSEIEICEYLTGKYPDGDIEGCKAFVTKFWSHYENNGWKVGKNKMSNWKLAIPQWNETLQKMLFPKQVIPFGIQKPAKPSNMDIGADALRLLMQQENNQ